jgi:hypothetical protein
MKIEKWPKPLDRTSLEAVEHEVSLKMNKWPKFQTAPINGELKLAFTLSRPEQGHSGNPSENIFNNF